MERKNIIVSKAYLMLSLQILSKREQVMVIRTLKEAAIRAQRFGVAADLRDWEKSLTGGKSGVNHRAKTVKRSKP
ncbi:hypothetical protein [Prosthecobacter sp.]|uniref:hypothetical protein n=1 Tax=Prosthecobacter sp. TaxID=1965333 RepID=UPI003784C518